MRHYYLRFLFRATLIGVLLFAVGILTGMVLMSNIIQQAVPPALLLLNLGFGMLMGFCACWLQRWEPLHGQGRADE